MTRIAEIVVATARSWPRRSARGLRAAALLPFLGSLACVSEAPRKGKPTIVIVIADDQGWGDLSHHGNTNLETPNIDSLARDGASFRHFFASAVCSPTRAELLTGRYHPRGGVRGTSAGAERLDLDERTLAETFKHAGYATGAFGKWHNGSQHLYHPNARGFDEFYGFTSGHWALYFDPPLDHNGRAVRGSGFIIDDLTDHALSFIEDNAAKGEPFFLYVPYNTPHSPMQVPDRFYERFAGAELPLRHRDPDKEDLEHTRAAMAMVENIDWNVGRLLHRLDELGLGDDTLVLYMSDNGPNGWRWNGGMKGRKGTLDEGGLRVPAFVRWPGKIDAGQEVEPIAAAIDLLPTLAELAGVEVVGDRPLDGRSLAPLLVGERAQETWPDREIASFHRGEVTLRTQRFRLDPEGRLFDLQEDPGQRVDITDKQPAEARRLQRLAEELSAEMAGELGPVDDRPFLIGGDRDTLETCSSTRCGGQWFRLQLW